MNEDDYQNIERRQSFRLDMEKEFVGLQWQDDNNQLVTKKVICLDFSKGGMKLDSDQSIAVDTPVTIVIKPNESQSRNLSGKVIRCTQQDNGWYLIALRLVD